MKLCWNLPEFEIFKGSHNDHVRFHLFKSMQSRLNQVNASALIFDLSAIIDMAIRTNSSVHTKKKLNKLRCSSISILGAHIAHTIRKILIFMNWIASKQTMKGWQWWTTKKTCNHFRTIFSLVFCSKRTFYFNINVT